MNDQVINCEIEFFDSESKESFSSAMNRSDSLLIIDLHNSNKMLDGEEFSLLCEYNPEVFIKFIIHNDLHRYEFCLDCGQGKYYKNGKQILSSYFYPVESIILNITKSYFKAFNPEKYKSAQQSDASETMA